MFATRWVHLFEQDTAAGEVYAPADSDVPLSRRPRAQLSLHPDGSATVFVPGPDDRLVPQSSSWADQEAEPGVRGAPVAELRVVEQSPARLVIARTKPM